MKLTTEQRRAVRHEGNTHLIACPGSGKTRCIIAKLLHCLPEVRGTARKIGCITYTNAAVYEIEHRLRTLGSAGDDELYEVNTIHAFCLNNILRHFYWRLDEIKDGFQVIPPDSSLYAEIVGDVCEAFGRRDDLREAFGMISRDPNGTPLVPASLSPEMALEFWKRLSSQGLIDFPSILYFSLTLLRRDRSIEANLSARFAWLLIDEFQDTTSLQVEIFRIIAKQGLTRFFLVGDPFQSIYGFAHASPQLMKGFAAHINACSDFQLTENFRASPCLVTHAEAIWARTPPMRSVGETSTFPDEVHYHHASSPFAGVTDEFLPRLEHYGIPFGKAAILAPSWYPLFPLGRQLREYGIPIVGPGARPYRRSHLFAALSEIVCAQLYRPRPTNIPQIERQLFTLVTELTGAAPYSVFSYNGRKVVYELLHNAEDIRERSESAVAWLKEASTQFAEILAAANVLPSSLKPRLQESALGMLADMEKNRVDVPNLSVEALGLFACPEDNLKLLSMHASKGREFEAVALIDVHEGKIPDYRATTADQLNESRRLFYVATTRAQKILVYISDQCNYRNTPSSFLNVLPCYQNRP
jgi:DNA helicase II / ATP-dependent DNA helicase PcrA